MTASVTPVMDADAIHAFVSKHFPQAHGFARVLSVGEQLTLELVAGDHNLRPGGTVSGPTLMTMADTAMYYLILSRIGPVALTVTTNLNINFLQKPPPGALTATATMLKLGKRLAVGEVSIESDGCEGPVAHATITYSIPPPDKRAA